MFHPFPNAHKEKKKNTSKSSQSWLMLILNKNNSCTLLLLHLQDIQVAWLLVEQIRRLQSWWHRPCHGVRNPARTPFQERTGRLIAWIFSLQKDPNLRSIHGCFCLLKHVGPPEPSGRAKTFKRRSQSHRITLRLDEWKKWTMQPCNKARATCKSPKAAWRQSQTAAHEGQIGR